MIIVRFTSGLGNQMFQYNLYSTLRQRFPQVKVKADVSWFARFAEHQGFELESLFLREDNPSFVFEKATDAEIIRCSGRIPNRVKGKAGEVWQFLLRIPHRILKLTGGSKYADQRIDQSGFEDNADIYEKLLEINPEQDYYITGFFIEEIYYKDRVDFLRNSLKFPSIEAEDVQNTTYAEAIRRDFSVSIHVRRGDYLSQQYSSSFLTLPMDYYKKAVEMVLEEQPDAKFFIFSDDEQYIRDSFTWIEKDKMTIISGNSGDKSFRDLQLMSMCKYNITANSTFSMWAGILNRNVNAKVFYPSIYMREKDSEIKLMDGWVRI